ncbi:ATP-grasp fold amidoligase family protein [Photobacterium sp. MCCC 1A19761]|uniref:ATP-grasp fold amidoligase family protein n=1 Tax=Photobacterium sp. MCCC 1A19761 TaxID=3115000 RepID=UPI00307E2BEF
MIRNFILAIFKMLPQKLHIWLRFRYHVGYFPSFKNPRSYNEKLQLRKLYDKNPLFPICSDKLAVRDYVTEKVGSQYLVPLLYEGEDINKEVLESLHEDYVVKPTHDSGSACIVQQKDHPDLNAVVSKIRQALNNDFGTDTLENWYSDIKPRVLIEKMLKNADGKSPDDFKFHVFNSDGECKVIFSVDYDRHKNHSRTFYNEDLEVLPFSAGECANYFLPIEHLDNYEEMLDVVKKLAADFDYVRVDLYNLDGKIYFGELTFAPQSGFLNFSDFESDYQLGSYWKMAPKQPHFSY